MRRSSRQTTGDEHGAPLRTSPARPEPRPVTSPFASRQPWHLYTGILRRPGNLRLNILRTGAFQTPTLMTVLVDRESVDQPYVQTATRRRQGGGRPRLRGQQRLRGTRRPDGDRRLLPDSGTPPPPGPPSGFVAARIEARATSGRTVRRSGRRHRDGTVYATFYRWTSFVGGIATADVVVVRDNGQPPAPFTALVDPIDHLTGRLVVQNRRVPFINQSSPPSGRNASSVQTSPSLSTLATVPPSTLPGPTGWGRPTTPSTCAVRWTAGTWSRTTSAPSLTRPTLRWCHRPRCGWVPLPAGRRPRGGAALGHPL